MASRKCIVADCIIILLLLYRIISIIWNITPTGDKESEMRNFFKDDRWWEKGPESIGWREMLVTSTASDAYKMWIKSSSEETKAKGIIKNRTTRDIINKEAYGGGIEPKPDRMIHGHVDAFYVKQSDMAFGLEGFVRFEVAAGKYTCFMYWFANARQYWRSQNKLGLGCIETQFSADIAATLWDRCTNHIQIVPLPDMMNLKHYGNTSNHVQHCNEQFCIDGAMSPGHNFNITILIFPQTKYDWHDIAPEADQLLAGKPLKEKMVLSAEENARDDGDYASMDPKLKSYITEQVIFVVPFLIRIYKYRRNGGVFKLIMDILLQPIASSEALPV